MPTPRFAIAALALALATLPAHARIEGGLDGGVSGNGGTFTKSPFSKHLVFWDLFQHNPRIQDNEAGDKIQLSLEGEAARGEWLDYHNFKSYRFLQHRLERWSRRAPHFVRVMRENDSHRDLLMIGTTLHFQKILELHLPVFAKQYGGIAVPGAYFDYSKGRILLDVSVWNQAGIQSQAAMLLHERLRELQLRYELSNETIQEIVYHIVIMEPEHQSRSIFDDRRFDSRAPDGNVHEAWPVRHARTDALPTAGKEIREAEAAGILGTQPFSQPVELVQPGRL